MKTKLVDVICDYENDRDVAPNRIVVKGDDDQFIGCVEKMVDIPENPLDNMCELEVFGISIVHELDKTRDLPYIYVKRVSDSE